MNSLINTSLPVNSNLPILPQSVVGHEGVEYALARNGKDMQLVLLGNLGDARLQVFEGEYRSNDDTTLLLAPLTAINAAALRAQLPWLQPRLLGLQTSAGMGDRLGLATPGHIRALRQTDGAVAPILAQQSMREMTRTGRTPQQVLDDATWGVFQENWQAGYGADADHLKNPSDVDTCLEAGFTFFTIDPGEHVDNRAEAAGAGELHELAAKLPTEMCLHANGLLGQNLKIERVTIDLNEYTLLKAMVKYGRAVWHVAMMYQHLKSQSAGRPFELEVSVDETAQPTSHADHAYIASELRRLGVEWVSLAPRFVGEFEKGVDYIGDVAGFEADIAGHAAVARHFGGYKLSLHSGSDKFSIYPAAMRQTRGRVHLKTAGTSYLEALRTVAMLDTQLFSEIYAFARSRYETDRVSYHVSAKLERAPRPDQVSDWSSLLDQFDAREILHVTFGSVLRETTPGGSSVFAERLFHLLRSQPETYARNLEKHFIRHLSPFMQAF